LAKRPTVFDDYILAFDVTTFRQPISEARDQMSRVARRSAIDKADYGHCQLLCSESEWRHDGRGADRGKEGATSHAIISWAVGRSWSRPDALVIFTSITPSYD
jgi:hypothetical protein